MFSKIIYRNLFNRKMVSLIIFSIIIFIIALMQTRNHVYRTSVYEVMLIGHISEADIAAALNFMALPFFISYIGMSVINRDQKNNFIEVMAVRGKNRFSYRKITTVSALVTGGIVAIFPTVINFLLFSHIYQSASLDLFNMPLARYIFSSILYGSPLLFFILNTIILYFFGVATVALSLIIKYTFNPKYNVEVIIPFILHMFLLFSASVAYTIPFHDELYYLISIFTSYVGIIVFIIIPIVAVGGVYIAKKNRDYI